MYVTMTYFTVWPQMILKPSIEITRVTLRTQTVNTHVEELFQSYIISPFLALCSIFNLNLQIFPKGENTIFFLSRPFSTLIIMVPLYHKYFFRLQDDYMKHFIFL